MHIYRCMHRVNLRFKLCKYAYMQLHLDLCEPVLLLHALRMRCDGEFCWFAVAIGIPRALDENVEDVILIDWIGSDSKKGLSGEQLFEMSVMSFPHTAACAAGERRQPCS